jgi:hypothetical protein
MDELEQLARAFLAAVSRGDVERMVSMYHPEGQRRVGPNVTKGHDAFRNRGARVANAFSDRALRIVKAMRVPPNTIILEYVETYRQVGPMPTPHGDIEPSDVLFDANGVAIIEFEGDKVKELRPYSDGLFQMLARSRFAPGSAKEGRRPSD